MGQPPERPTVTGQHLRPLFAFVVVAIVGAVVFANAFRAQDVLDAIRGGASDVFAGTPLLHEPLYVVEPGEQIEAAPVPEPEVDSADGTGSAPVGPSVGGSPATTAPVPVPTPAAGSDSGPITTGQAPQGGGGVRQSGLLRWPISSTRANAIDDGRGAALTQIPMYAVPEVRLFIASAPRV